MIDSQAKIDDFTMMAAKGGLLERQEQRQALLATFRDPDSACRTPPGGVEIRART